MTELYRFRSINYLLGKYNELENQSIYFASPEKLNDPLEGLRNIFWQGDQIVWRNFFKQYIYCLLRTTIHQKICGDLITRDKLELFIPVEKRRDKFTKETSQSPATTTAAYIFLRTRTSTNALSSPADQRRSLRKNRRHFFRQQNSSVISPNDRRPRPNCS